MCNPEFTDGMREQVRKLITHTDELRLKYGDLAERHRVGNLGNEAIEDLNQVIHLLESDSAAFEKLLEKA